MKRKKIVSLLLAGLLTAGMMSGCGGQSGNDASGGQSLRETLLLIQKRKMHRRKMMRLGMTQGRRRTMPRTMTSRLPTRTSITALPIRGTGATPPMRTAATARPCWRMRWTATSPSSSRRATMR